MRDLSSKLIFYNLVQDGIELQVVYSFQRVGGDVTDFRKKVASIRVGDIVSES